MKGDILIVDDQPANLILLETLLKAEGYKVRAATNGPLALQVTAARPPEIILLDVTMPEMDGYEVCQRLKTSSTTANIPVLFLSAHLETEEKLRAFEAGGQDYITKPFAAAEVLARVKVHLEHYRMETQLKRANDESKAFAHSVSHDLRAPLRQIISYLQIFQEDYASQLDEPAGQVLARIVTISQHMQTMVDDLLQLSRLSHIELRFQTVNLSELVQNIASELQAAEPARQVEFVIAPDLSAQSDPGLMRAALTNLLSNAWKFTGRCEKARIEFGALSRAYPTYFVRDNGAGFNMQYASRLFGVFQRLHTESEFPGVGVGLATVRRVIERQGGRVWAEAKVDQGATFYFTLGETGEVPL